MNVTNLANLYRAQQTVSVSALDPVQKAMKKGSARLEDLQQSTEVKLSSYGQVKAGFARIQDAGETLTKSASLSAANAKQALQSLVSAYNETRSVAAATAPGSASNAANSLRRTAASDGMRADLQTLGITRQNDGSLAIDAKKLDQALASNSTAVKEALSRVGGQFGQNASRALSENSGLNKTLNALATQNQQLQARENDYRNFANAQLASGTGSFPGIADYQKIFSM